MSAAEERLLVALSAARLARRGWPAARTAALLAEALPGGATRTELAAAAASLARGEPAAPFAHGGLGALLARAEAAPEALEELAGAAALELRAARAARAALLHPVSLAALAVLMISVGSGARQAAAALHPEGVRPGLLPSAAAALLPVVLVLGVAALLVAAIALAASLAGRGFLPGVRPLRAASRLRQVAAALRAGATVPQAFAVAGAKSFDDLPFDEHERCLARRLSATLGPQEAATALATELEQSGAEARQLAALLFPIAGAIVLFFLLLLAFLAVIVPLFSFA